MCPLRADAPLRVGVAGVGSLGFHHARILADLSDVVMVGVYDSRAERTGEVAGQLGVPERDSLDSLLDTVEALVVAVPTTHHERIAVAALGRGIAVLIEKPIASTLVAADRILAAAQASDAIVQIGHIERFNAAVVAAEPYLDTPLFVESHRLAPFSPRSTDVAVVLDLMIHDVDLVRSLIDRPVQEIGAVGVPVLTSSADIANARLLFESGAVANLTASRISRERMRKIRIFQRSGYLSLNLAEGTGEFLRLRGGLPGFARPDGEHQGEGPLDLADIVERVPIVGDGVEPLRRELESFRDAVLGRSPPVVSGEEGRAVLEVTLDIQERVQRTAGASSSAPAPSQRSAAR